MTGLVWVAVLATAVAWGLPLFTRSTPVPAGASLATAALPASGSLGRLLGQPPAQPLADAPVVVQDSRFRLLGVVAPRSGRASGLALISIDGKPARAVGVGRELEPGLRVLTVAHRQVELGAGGGAPSVTLSLPPLAEAQRGTPADLSPAGFPTMLPGMPQPGTFNGLPGAMRVPPLPVPVPGSQPLPPVPVPQGLPPVTGNLPYVPENDGNPAPGNPAANRLR